MEVPRLGAELELQLLAYPTAHGNAGSFNLLSEARDGTHILMDSSWAHYHGATRGTSQAFPTISLLQSLGS